ncbi:MAG: LON peptidase substrate-binding domain-containing protein, partial [Terriglobales bacterium]
MLLSFWRSQVKLGEVELWRTILRNSRREGSRRLFLSSLLPLFPLDLVLLPGTPLPLHIFEPRYREMISEC